MHASIESHSAGSLPIISSTTSRRFTPQARKRAATASDRRRMSSKLKRCSRPSSPVIHSAGAALPRAIGSNQSSAQLKRSSCGQRNCATAASRSVRWRSSKSRAARKGWACEGTSITTSLHRRECQRRRPKPDRSRGAADAASVTHSVKVPQDAHQRSIACRTSSGRSVSGQCWQSIVCTVTLGPASAVRIAAASANVAPVDSSASTGTPRVRGNGAGANISATSCR